MTAIALLRHGPTHWNTDGRLQGHRDIELSDEGRAAVGDWRLPEPWGQVALVSSPLRRCLDTIDILRVSHDALGPQSIDPRFVEMDWGAWEGRTLGDVRDEQGAAMVRIARLGFDLRHGLAGFAWNPFL